MLITKKMLLVLTLVGALVGAGIGSLITHTAANSPAANSQAANSYNTPQTASLSENPSERTPDQIAAERSSQFSTAPERTAYRQGFDEVIGVACGGQLCLPRVRVAAGVQGAMHTERAGLQVQQRHPHLR